MMQNAMLMSLNKAPTRPARRVIEWRPPSALRLKCPMRRRLSGRLSGRASGLALAVALLSQTPALQAQQMYKCGNTYSQTPCAPDAAAARVFSGAAPDKAQGRTGFDLCAAAAPAASRTPEPESARIRQASPRKAEVIPYAGQSIAAHRYDVAIDAKTQYGVYSGEQLFSCWLSEDQARILRFQPR